MRNVRQAERRGDERTRNALIAVAARYLRERGALPSYAEVAAAARVPRRTAYRYFSSLEDLAAAATVENLRPEMDRLVSPGLTTPDAAARIEATARAMAALTGKHERLFRTMVRFTISNAEHETTARGRSRIEWFRTALAPLRKRLDDAQFERLLAAIVLCIGPETLIVLRDVCGIKPQDAGDVVAWIGRTLVNQALAEAS